MKISDTRTAALRRHASLLKLGTGALALAVGSTWAVPAMAQSTASQEIQEIIVTGSRQQQFVGGLITAETSTKARSSIDQSFIESQNPGQSVAQLINLLPGVSFVNNDPYGNSGGNLRLRGFDGNRVSLTFDGMPLNDTGNYAIFTNQQLDSELISRVNVNLGTTDIDSPTASAAGGTVNYITRRPKADPGIEASVGVGTDNYRRFFSVVDTGELGPYKTSAFLGASYTKYDKFRGEGELEKKQINARIYQPLRGDDFISVAFHYNENRNNAYANLARSVYDTRGFGADFNSTLLPLTTNAATATSAATTTDPGDNTNYFDYRINPSDTGNVRAQSRFAITDNLTFTFDPSIQYTLATGGTTTTVLSEGDARLRGTLSSTIRAVDLNGSCTAAGTIAGLTPGTRLIPTSIPATTPGCGTDSVRIYAPNFTNTWRPGLTSSLIYEVNEQHTVRVAYTLDYGRHRQTGEGSLLDGNRQITRPWAGKKGDELYSADGRVYQARDRYSVAQLNQIAAEYQGKFLDEALRINAGARFPFFKRELNQFCYTSAGTSVVCTSNPATLANVFNPTPGNLPVGTTGVNATPIGYLAPFKTTYKFNEILPTFGMTYKFLDEHQVNFNYSRGLSVPRTDDLYARAIPTAAATANTVQPFSKSALPNVSSERSDNFDLGYRYQGDVVVGSVATYYNKFTNFIVTSLDPISNERISRNVGDVESYGFNAEVGVEPLEGLTSYLQVSYDNRELQDDYAIGFDRRLVSINPTTGAITAGCTANCTVANNLVSTLPSDLYYVQNGVVFLRTRGKQLVEVPEWTIGGRVQYKINDLRLGVNVKWTGERYSTDVNDDKSDSFTTVNLDVSYDIDKFIGNEGSRLQLNITNLFDEDYFGNINSGSTASNFLLSNNPFTPQYSIGAPFSAVVSLKLVY